MSNPTYSWTRSIENSQFLISNDTKAISRDFIQTAFAGDDINWTGPVPAPILETMIEKACTLGMYAVEPKGPVESTNDDHPVRSQIGFARIITDYATIAYLTDVYIDPKYRKLGLGKWLMACFQEICAEMPALRRSLLLTGAAGKGPKFYEQELGMKVVQGADEGTVLMMSVANRKHPVASTSQT